jgi:virginiamycin B lyase
VITRITTSGEVSGRYPIPTVNADPLGLVAAPDGRLWIAEHSASTLDRVTLDGAFSRDVRLRSAPDALTLGPDGALWYVSGDDGKVGRLELGR